MRETLGSGILALIPTSKLPHSFESASRQLCLKYFLTLLPAFTQTPLSLSTIEHFMQNALMGRQPPHSHLPIEHLSDDQLQEMHLSDLVRLFEPYTAPTIKDILPYLLNMFLPHLLNIFLPHLPNTFLPPVKHISSPLINNLLALILDIYIYITQSKNYAGFLD